MTEAKTAMTPDADVAMWTAGWGHAGLDRKSISGAPYQLVEFVKWDAAKQALDNFVAAFEDHEDYARRSHHLTVTAEEIERWKAELDQEIDSKLRGSAAATLVPGAEFVMTLESCTGEVWAFGIEWDGPAES